MWQDKVQRCDRSLSRQAHPTDSPTFIGEDAQMTPRDNVHPPGAQGNRTPESPHKPKMPYALESYLSQSIKEEAWNNLFGFFTREDFDESVG